MKTISVKQAAEMTGCSKSFIYKLINEGLLPAKKIGRKIVVLEEELNTWIADLPSAKGEIYELQKAESSQ